MLPEQVLHPISLPVEVHKVLELRMLKDGEDE